MDIYNPKIQVNLLNMRLVNLRNLPVQNTYRNKHSFIRAKYGTEENPARSLDLLRQVLQPSINVEIDKIIKHYVQTYFEPAKHNIKENSGLSEDSVQEFVTNVSCQILEEAKQMYSSQSINNLHNTRQQNMQGSSNTKVSNNNLNKTSTNNNPIKNNTDNNNYTPRRKRTNSSGSESNLPFLSKRKHLVSHFKNNSGRSTPTRTKVVKMPVKKEGPKWDSNRLTTDTKFIMGSKANKALGLGATRGRLYIKHPELFKYGGDKDDKQWLYENALMPATGGRTYLLILEDILQLTLLSDYKNSADLQLRSMIGFNVPWWMVDKMKSLMDSQHTNKSAKSFNNNDDVASGGGGDGGSVCGEEIGAISWNAFGVVSGVADGNYENVDDGLNAKKSNQYISDDDAASTELEKPLLLQNTFTHNVDIDDRMNDDNLYISYQMPTLKEEIKTEES